MLVVRCYALSVTLTLFLALPETFCNPSAKTHPGPQVLFVTSGVNAYLPCSVRRHLPLLLTQMMMSTTCRDLISALKFAYLSLCLFCIDLSLSHTILHSTRFRTKKTTRFSIAHLICWAPSGSGDLEEVAWTSSNAILITKGPTLLVTSVCSV